MTEMFDQPFNFVKRSMVSIHSFEERMKDTNMLHRVCRLTEAS